MRSVLKDKQGNKKFSIAYQQNAVDIFNDTRKSSKKASELLNIGLIELLLATGTPVDEFSEAAREAFAQASER